VQTIERIEALYAEQSRPPDAWRFCLGGDPPDGRTAIVGTCPAVPGCSSRPADNLGRTPGHRSALPLPVCRDLPCRLLIGLAVRDESDVHFEPLAG